MTFLLDVSVAIALIDPAHVSHSTVQAWFAAGGSSSYATCPIVQNGVLRIVGHPSYPQSPGSPAAAWPALASLTEQAGHSFWSDDVDIMSSTLIDGEKVRTSGQVTDTYLLALAVHHGGKLATLDLRLSAAAVKGGAQALHIIRSS